VVPSEILVTLAKIGKDQPPPKVSGVWQFLDDRSLLAEVLGGSQR
jgi:hypothetical protein